MLVESQAGDVLAMDANRSGVRRIEADDEPQQHALSRAAASEHGQRFSPIHAQADPVQNLVAREGLVHVLDGNNGRTGRLCSGFCLLRRNVRCCGSYLFRECFEPWIKGRKRE